VRLFANISLLLLGLAVSGLGGRLAAQDPAFARVRGYVFDSLLTGATAPEAHVALSGPTSRVVVADGRGRFLVDSLLPGEYLIAFTHPAWDEVGYTPTPRKVTLNPGMNTVFLSSTAGHGIFAALCPNVQDERTGVVLGALTDVRTGQPIPGGDVRVEWTESEVSVVLGVNTRTRVVRSPVDSSGRYRLCGVPNDTPVLLKASVGLLDGPPLELDLEERPVAIRMLSLDRGPAAAEGQAVTINPDSGTARLRGSVTATDGKPVPGAQVVVHGHTATAQSTESGSFELGGLPGGTHTVEVRAIGYTKARRLVELRPDSVARVELTLARQAVILPEVAVTAEAPKSEFDQRRTSAASGGHYITQEDIERRGAIRTEDLFRTVPGFNVVPSGGFDYRVVSSRTVGASGQCSPQFYIDGARITVDPLVGGGLPINPQDIYGIETYSSNAVNAPPEYQSGNGCGVILIWTKRGRRR